MNDKRFETWWASNPARAALICADYNPGMVSLARDYDLLVYEVSE